MFTHPDIYTQGFQDYCKVCTEPLTLNKGKQLGNIFKFMLTEPSNYSSYTYSGQNKEICLGAFSISFQYTVTKKFAKKEI